LSLSIHSKVRVSGEALVSLVVQETRVDFYSLLLEINSHFQLGFYFTLHWDLIEQFSVNSFNFQFIPLDSSRRQTWTAALFSLFHLSCLALLGHSFHFPNISFQIPRSSSHFHSTLFQQRSTSASFHFSLSLFI